MANLRRVALAFVTVVGTAAAALAGDYLFVNPVYVAETREVIAESREKAPAVFKDTETAARFDAVSGTLDGVLAEKQRAFYLKKVKPESVAQTNDAAFAKALNDYKDALGFLSETAGAPLNKLLPSYGRWNALETAVVKGGLDQRLAAYQTRFGPDSEPINILELLISQKFIPGDEAGPSPWEPIARVAAVQVTSRGSGLTSTIQLGVNHYFVRGAPPKPLQWLTISNHVGVAAMLQYLDNPGVLELKGRPAFGVMLHVDRKEIGVSWDNAEDRLNLTLGYAFQFVPLLM